MERQRIEYIDAMRGLTMILVVYSHICRYCLGDETMGFNSVFFLFRLPCFFFISGWLFEQPGRVWNQVTVRHVISRKFMVQIVPTVIFLLLLAPPPLFFTRLGAQKGGYWFTFALFEFFVLYILSSRYCRRWEVWLAVAISVLAFAYDVFYSRYFSHMGLLTDALGFLGFMTWRYYLFFFLGTLVKRHFEAFLRMTGKPSAVISVVIGFIIVAMIPHTESVVAAYGVFAVGGILGMTMVFTFFRHFEAFFTKEKLLGRSLQYVGTRTLDIYLLHYFVLPRFLLPFGTTLRSYNCALLELLTALALALIIVLICLAASYLIRLNPFLGHYLFGARGPGNLR